MLQRRVPEAVLARIGDPTLPEERFSARLPDNMSEQPTETPELSEAEQTQPIAETAEEKTPPGLLQRLSIFGFVRLAMGLLGLGGFVTGVIVAWHSTSATTLLIVSGILLVLAALGLDWGEIGGTGPGGWAIQLLRRGWENVGERIEQVAASEEVTPAIREELEALRAEVKALTPPTRPRRPRQPTQPVDTASLRDLLRTRATHSFYGADATQLSLRTTSSADGALHVHRQDADRCLVQRSDA
jgi:hypothetical protein